MSVNEKLTTSQWVWLQADTTAPQSPGGISAQTRKDKSIRVVWRIWDALSVPDWHFGNDGKLDWIIIESEVYDNSDPMAEPKKYKLRTLFERRQDGVYKSEFSENAQAPVTKDKKLDGYTEIPIVLVGTLSADGWWFDDVEMLQAQSLNLDSIHKESLGKTVFPQIVISQATIDTLNATLSNMSIANGQEIVAVREIIRGMEYPIVEDEASKNTTRYVIPSHADMKTIPDELMRTRSLLFDMAGLALFNKEGRQIQTAESKQFDHLDTSSTLKNRALLMQEAEVKMVILSKDLDASFAEYVPVWPSSFDVVDVQALTSLLSVIANCPDLTPAMLKMYRLLVIEIMREVANFKQELVDEAMNEAEAADDEREPSDDKPT